MFNSQPLPQNPKSPSRCQARHVDVPPCGPSGYGRRATGQGAEVRATFHEFRPTSLEPLGCIPRSMIDVDHTNHDRGKAIEARRPEGIQRDVPLPMGVVGQSEHAHVLLVSQEIAGTLAI